MRDWLGVYLGCIGSWVVTAIDFNGITLAAACLTSISTVIITVVCGLQRISKGRSERLAEQHRRFKEECEAILARDKVCDECLDDGGAFIQDCTFIHRHKNCPKN